MSIEEGFLSEIRAPGKVSAGHPTILEITLCIKESENKKTTDVIPDYGRDFAMLPGKKRTACRSFTFLDIL